MKSKLLYINTYIPYPLNSGGNQAFFTITNYIRKQYDLSLLLYIHNSKDMENVKELQELWPDVTFYLYEPHEQPKTNPYAYMPWPDRTICTVFDFLWHSLKRKVNRRVRRYNNRVAKNGEHEGDMVRSNSTLFMVNEDMTSSFMEYVKLISSKGFDIVQVEFYDYLQLVYVLPKTTKKVFVHHELRFVRNENELQFFKHPKFTDHILFEELKWKEIGALNAYDAVVTLTEIDKDILCRYLSPNKVFSSPALTKTVTQERLQFKPCKDLVFVGSGSHFPNADGMVWFCKEVVPLLQQKDISLPTIYVTGEWKKELQEDLKKLCPTLHFTGFVDDLQQFLNGKISVVSIRIGSGMRMKILDSISAAAPIVTTSKGCEGLPMVHHKNCLIANSAENFAQAIEEILTDVKLQEQLVISAQNTETSMLNEEELFKKRTDVYNALLGNS